MPLRTFASALVAVALTGCAGAQVPRTDEDHSAHHPPGSVSTLLSSTAQASRAVPDAFDRQMEAMRSMHSRMQSAKTPAERAALMEEHMKLMQSGMAMMGPMNGAGSVGVQPGMPGMMGMHQQMERRMAMMEQMMQMMVDRETAMPRP